MILALFVSRNKDNLDLPEFEPRAYSQLFKSELIAEKEFEEFVNKGLIGEVSRLYVNVNPISPEKVNRQLQHFLLDNLNYPPHALQNKIVSIAGKIDSKLTKNFLLDCDVNHSEFLEIISKVPYNPEEIDHGKTPNGYYIICRGFDTRYLLDNHPNVTLIRDGMRFIKQKTKY